MSKLEDFYCEKIEKIALGGGLEIGIRQFKIKDRLWLEKNFENDEKWYSRLIAKDAEAIAKTLFFMSRDEDREKVQSWENVLQIMPGGITFLSKAMAIVFTQYGIEIDETKIEEAKKKLLEQAESAAPSQ